VSDSCAGCPSATGPDIMPENEDVLELMLSVRTQWRGAAFGIIGLDYVALHNEANNLGIDRTPCLMGKIRALESLELNRMNKREKKD
jgi:hypothetical protein